MPFTLRNKIPATALAIAFAVTRDTKYLWLAGGGIGIGLYKDYTSDASTDNWEDKLLYTLLLIPCKLMLTSTHSRIGIQFVGQKMFTVFTTAACKPLLHKVLTNDLNITSPLSALKSGLRECASFTLKNIIEIPVAFSQLPTVLRNSIKNGLTSSISYLAISSDSKEEEQSEERKLINKFFSSASATALNYAVKSIAAQSAILHDVYKITKPAIHYLTSEISKSIAKAI